MPKRQPEGIVMKYLPVALVAVSAISGYTLLTARVSGAEEKIKDIQVIQAKLSTDSSDIRVSQAKQESKLDSIYELVKEIKSKS